MSLERRAASKWKEREEELLSVEGEWGILRRFRHPNHPAPARSLGGGHNSKLFYSAVDGMERTLDELGGRNFM